MKKSLILIFLFPIFLNAQVDTVTPSLVKWLTIEQAEELCATEQRPILIDIYTDWCGWCKHMLKTTYSNRGIASYINNNFFAVQLNAENQDTLIYNGKKYPPRGKYSSLALELMDGRASFPTTVLISRDRELTIPIPGYQKPHEIEPLLVYYNENIHRFININEYRINHIFTYPNNFKEDLEWLKPDEKPDTSGTPIWTDITEVWQKSRKDKRKFVIFTDFTYCYSCKVMKKISFSDPIIAEEVNKNFYLSYFDFLTTDTISINGVDYTNKGNGYVNSLVMKLYNGNPGLPSIVILDENFEVLRILNGYANPLALEPFLVYYSSDAYKKQTYQDFYKTFESKLKLKK